MASRRASGTIRIVCGVFGAISAVFICLAVWAYFRTALPNDMIAIVSAFAWVFLSVTGELAAIARAGLFVQVAPRSTRSPGRGASQVFTGMQVETSGAVEAQVAEPVLKRRLVIFMLASALALLVFEVVLYRAEVSGLSGFLFSCFPVLFMGHWAFLKLRFKD